MIITKNIKITKNPFLLFLPFLILYIAIVLIHPTHGTDGDEGRYLIFAENLINGFYSPPSPDIDLGNGPGYPIILIIFIAMHLPLICITLLNPLFYYLSIILLFKAFQHIVSIRVAFIFSLFWACYYNSYESMPFVSTEIFASSLVPLLIFSLINAFNPDLVKNKKIYIFLSGFTIGYLALTKPIFGYVIMSMLVGSGFLWLINRSSNTYKKGTFILLIALITTIPYLIYTYHLTNKIFYWGSVGGNNIYWMSSPYEGEYGNWIEYPVSQNEGDRVNGSKDLIELRHQKDFIKIVNDKGIEQDDILKGIAINNIISHPAKFIQNCFSNVGRIIFNFPYSYKLQKPGTLLRLPLNGIIVVLALFCFIPTLINWQKIIFPIRFLLFFALIYFGGSILGSAETRMFTIIVPILLAWISYIFYKSMKIKLKFD